MFDVEGPFSGGAIIGVVVHCDAAPLFVIFAGSVRERRLSNLPIVSVALRAVLLLPPV
jgi:hypothetical protein